MLSNLYEILKRAEDPKAAVEYQEKCHMCADQFF